MSWGSTPHDESGADAWDAAWGSEAEDMPADRYSEGFLLGEGGMGVVTSVEDTHLDRLVARKVVQDPTPRAEARLLREARITAKLDHPGVVPVHDVGRTDDGRLYYTMRLVRGRTLSKALPALSRARALRHFLDVCGTVAYAHAVGIGHRDLKPSNILVGPFGETQVADWGLAIALDDDAARAERVGTSAYMSPEVAAGAPFDTRSEVWSLGVILAEILTGRPPFGRGADALRRVQAGVAPALPIDDPELAAIVRCALQPDPAERYETAEDLADDLEAWFDGRAVGVYRYSAFEHLKRAAWAWRGPLSASVAIAGVVVAAALTTAVRTAHERDRALEAEQDAVRAQQAAERAEARALLGRSLDALDRDDRPAAELFAARSLTLEDSPEARGVLAAWHGIPRPRVTRSEPLTCDTAQLAGDAVVCIRDGDATVDGRSLEDATLVYALHDGSLAVMRERDRIERLDADGTVQASIDVFSGAIAFAPDAPVGIRVGQARTHVLDLASGVKSEPHACDAGIPQVATIGRAGRLWVACSDGSVRTGTGDAWHTVGNVSPEWGLASSIAVVGADLWVGTLHGALVAVGPTTPLERRAPTFPFDGAIAAIHPSPDGSRALVLRVGGDAVLVRTTDRGVQTRLPGRITDAAWLGPETLRTVGDRQEDWQVPNAVTGVRFAGPEGVSTVDLREGRLAIGRGDGTLEIRALAGGERTAWVDGYAGIVKHAMFAAGSSDLLFHAHDPNETGVVSEDGTVRTWPTRAALRVFAIRDTTDAVGWVPYGDGITLGPVEGPTHTLPRHRFVDADRTPDRRALLLLERFGAVMRLTPDGTLDAIASAENAVAIAATPTGYAIATPHAVAAHPEGTVWSPPGSEIVEVAVSPSGRWMVVGQLDGRVRVRDRTTGSTVAVLQGHRQRVGSLAFDGDAHLATGSWDGSARRWDLSALEGASDTLAESIEAAWGRDATALLTDSR